MENKKILIAMSGGVDSSAAAHLILEKGHPAIGATMRLVNGLPGNENVTDSEIEAAKNTCKYLGIEHHTVDLCKHFKKTVVDDFVEVYRKGKTPNPCIICNKNIKFGALWEYAVSQGCASLATGHYAVIEPSASGRYLIKKAKDPTKDQSYMLWMLSQEQLAFSQFPLGNMTKAEVRELAANLGLENSHKKDSQDICFIPDGDYAAFIERYTGKSVVPGDYVDMNGNILGKHQGIIRYTVGQRKGLGIALGCPMFVYSKDAATNTVTLCKNEDLFSKRLEADNINLIACDTIPSPTRLMAKARYHHEAVPATVTQTDENSFVVEFDSPVRAISPGQSVVLYDGNTLVGGGIIR